MKKHTIQLTAIMALGSLCFLLVVRESEPDLQNIRRNWPIRAGQSGAYLW